MTRNYSLSTFISRNRVNVKWRIALVLLFPFALLEGRTAPMPQTVPAANTPIAFVHVCVIDLNSSTLRGNYTVIIKGALIDQVGPSDQVNVPEGVGHLEARGKFLVPGLWDMHVHIGSNALLLPFYIANGVTAVRSMADSVTEIRNFRQQIEGGEITGPRIIATAGQIIDGPHAVWPGSVSAATESEGRDAVDQVIAEGSDFAKVYDMLPRAAYFGVAEESKRKNIPFAGHLPMSVTAVEASDAGQKSIEHLIGIPLACSAKEVSLREEVLESGRHADSAWPALRAYRRADSAAFDSYSSQKADTLYARLVNNRTWIVPTLTNTLASIHSDDKTFRSDPRLQYMPDNLLSFWQAGEHSHILTTKEQRSKNRSLQKYLHLVRAMHRKGVQILPGTDTPNPFSFPGFGLHDELKLLVKAGFTPAEALRAATRDSARFMGLLDSYGTVEPRKAADLILLDANPLKDINSIDKINAVVTRGRLFRREDLESLLRSARK